MPGSLKIDNRDLVTKGAYIIGNNAYITTRH